MAHFKTVSAVKEASEEQLAGAKGVSRAAARAAHAHFHPQPEQPSAETSKEARSGTLEKSNSGTGRRADKTPANGDNE